MSFRKGEVLAVVDRRDAYTEKGWLYGVKDGQFGLFPSDFVKRMSPAEVRREMRVIAKVTRPRKGHSDEDGEEATSSSDDEADKVPADVDDDEGGAKTRSSYREQGLFPLSLNFFNTF